MLPKRLRFRLFEVLSLKTMRYVHAIPRRKASGLVAQVYSMIEEDFFINGSLTSRSKTPALMAGIWTAGRESILVHDRLDRITKEAMVAVLSQVNDCPYCGDMLISLVHAGGKHEAASNIFSGREAAVTDCTLRARLAWVRSVASPGTKAHPATPFTAEELPEAIAALMVMSDINRFSHVVMDGSPVRAPFGLQAVKAAALRLFAGELKATQAERLAPGRALSLLPPHPLPADMQWATPNPRIADAIARWTGVVEREASSVVSPAVRELVVRNLQDWNGELMPISRSWVDADVSGLTGQDRAIARLALVLAKAPYQVDEKLVEEVLKEDRDEERFIRILSWASFSSARRFAQRLAEATAGFRGESNYAAQMRNVSRAADVCASGRAADQYSGSLIRSARSRPTAKSAIHPILIKLKMRFRNHNAKADFGANAPAKRCAESCLERMSGASRAWYRSNAER